ncbi:alpha-glucosidase C-terminal domain-containing protein, partial [uncultured Mucilaginibacter sp.]|uniref:alpha-amylase family glycosyl hydrolase n=1 Tax=uncultured Mucilaginibacter sp. TaxID=797541 RepID=UPI0025EBE79A
IKFNTIDDYKDIESISMFYQIKNNGGDLNAFLDAQKISARDNGRTPFQWDDSANAGFSNATPWIKVNPAYTSVNVAAEENDPNSCLNYFRRAVQLRKNNLILVYGKYTLVDRANPKVYAYTREQNGKKLLIALNFSKDAATFNAGYALGKATVLLGNYPSSSTDGTLKPYEAVVYQLND